MILYKVHEVDNFYDLSMIPPGHCEKVDVWMSCIQIKSDDYKLYYTKLLFDFKGSLSDAIFYPCIWPC